MGARRWGPPAVAGLTARNADVVADDRKFAACHYPEYVTGYEIRFAAEGAGNIINATAGKTGRYLGRDTERFRVCVNGEAAVNGNKNMPVACGAGLGIGRAADEVSDHTAAPVAKHARPGCWGSPQPVQQLGASAVRVSSGLSAPLGGADTT